MRKFEKKYVEEQGNQSIRYHKIGWGLFIICSLFFLIAGIKAHDIYTIIGSLLFLVACFFFLVPLLK
ncbi:hypothetical protein [Petrocella atlantisensis]|uniref:hypothetical protein n=1 Tax=Petrocella atlantisensis TaxID=2173034 RepID=UPI000F6341E2|nr:hypothetical protein [Petrocella atlantisensis]MCF8019729.1 hypothetical protein [Vallitaleaceae bacterium]